MTTYDEIPLEDSKCCANEMSYQYVKEYNMA